VQLGQKYLVNHFSCQICRLRRFKSVDNKTDGRTFIGVELCNGLYDLLEIFQDRFNSLNLENEMEQAF
jgi:hypothetical protein